MNETLAVINGRKSVRAYEEKPIPKEVKEAILHAAMRAPTGGNMMLYSILDITDQAIKERLAITCDNQPFIARAPLVLLFLADYQRWYDYFIASGLPDSCAAEGGRMRNPEEGDLFLACCDAVIAAQNAVIAAESLGVGSCYIGDILENYEIHRELLKLPDFVFPITMACFGYPTEQQKERACAERFGKEYIVFENQYKRLCPSEFDAMYKNMTEKRQKNRGIATDEKNIGQLIYEKKFAADFSKEMSRSVREMLKHWTGNSI